MPTFTPTATDNFTGIDQNPLAGNWTIPSTFSALQRLSNRCCNTVINYTTCEEYWSASSFPNNQYIRLTISALTWAAQPSAYMAVRASSVNGNAGYWATVSWGTNTNTIAYQIAAFNAADVNTHTYFTQDNVAGFNPGDVFTFAVIGTKLYFYKAAALVYTGTTLGEFSSGSIIIGISANSTSSMQFSAFEAGTAALSPSDTGGSGNLDFLNYNRWCSRIWP